MLFNSFEFLFVFLPITLLLYFILGKFNLSKWAVGLLVLASFAFYAYWDIDNVPILLASMLFNFFIGRLIEKTKSKVILTIGVAVNLSLLVIFKYSAFITTNVDSLGFHLPIPEFVMPLGISFFTFTQTAYLVDVYRRETENYNISKYSLFVTFFPHLIAGPILYHKDVIPQLGKNIRFNWDNMSIGIGFLAIGLFKKVVIADTLSPWVRTLFEAPDQASFVQTWTGVLAYTFQLYYDFSGYSDMAVGLGYMLNIKLPINFDSPYKALSIIDFWRRWHITLSAFLRNYLYIPLGGNRKGEFKRFRNLFLTMLIGGIWHGAGWTFIIWGALHGLYLVANHGWRKLKIPLPLPLAWCLTFTSIVVAWVFFRASDVTSAWTIVSHMFGGNGVTLAGYDSQKVSSLAILLLATLVIPNTQQITEKTKPGLVWGVAAAGLIAAILMNLTKVSEFLYFQF